MNRALPTRFGGERGSVLITGLLLTLALLMVLGTAVDIGHAFIIRRDLSSLADNAALAGAQQLDQRAIHEGRLALDPQQAQAAALSTMSGEPGVQVQADATPADVHVQVTRRFPTILLRLVGLADLTVSAQADAAPRAP
ncbi:MAG TPA: pilus assembly protein TadG-related protein [Gaiellaceae bacterium]|nr:pilus assembly protein TadG-related protein [Gaiellaceae bacterium]